MPGMGYHLLTTDEPLDKALTEYLSLRHSGQAAGRTSAAGRPVMGFLAPWFLAGMLAVGLPECMCICCASRQAVPRLVSSLMFFEQGTQSSVRHRRLRYLLLFALRTLAVLLLALAFARPFFRHKSVLASDKLLLVAVDDSFEYGMQKRAA